MNPPGMAQPAGGCFLRPRTIRSPTSMMTSAVGEGPRKAPGPDPDSRTEAVALGEAGFFAMSPFPSARMCYTLQYYDEFHDPRHHLRLFLHHRPLRGPHAGAAPRRDDPRHVP